MLLVKLLGGPASFPCGGSYPEWMITCGARMLGSMLPVAVMKASSMNTSLPHLSSVFLAERPDCFARLCYRPFARLQDLALFHRLMMIPYVLALLKALAPSVWGGGGGQEAVSGDVQRKKCGVMSASIPRSSCARRHWPPHRRTRASGRLAAADRMAAIRIPEDRAGLPQG